MNACFQEAAELGQLTSKVTRLYSKRLLDAETRFAERFPGPEAGKVTSNVPVSPWQTWQDWSSYLTDAVQRSLLFWDTIRRRGNQYLEHERAGKPPVLVFDYEMVVDGRRLERPVNYALVRILPPEGIRVDESMRPYLIVDPRAGHGPGIGGFKEDSQVGVALRAGCPVYFVIFFPEPVQSQTIRDVVIAQGRFVQEVAARHPNSPKPVIFGNCQGGWSVMLL
ncbi:MAG: DUF3141 domain-containing protein, partial [Isosphaeraceae bacterium]